MAMALLALGGCAPSQTEVLLQRHQATFKSDPAVVDLATLAWSRGVGQVEALAAASGEHPSDTRWVVEIGGSWCKPCVARHAEFVAAAKAAAGGHLRFAHLAVEWDAPDHEGVKQFILRQWNGGVEPTYPAWAVLDADLSAEHPLLASDLATALERARSPRDDAAPDDGADMGSDEEAWAAMLASFDPVMVDLDPKTYGDFASQLEAQTGVRIIIDRELGGREMSGRMRTLSLGAFSTLRGPFPFIARRGTSEHPPLLVVWDDSTIPAPRESGSR